MPGISAAAWAVPIAAAWRRVIAAGDPRIGVALAVAGFGAPAAQPLEGEQQDAVEDQEEGRGLGRGEEGAQRVLEGEAEDAGRDRPDHQQPAEPRVVVALADATVADRAAEALEDPHPVGEEVEEEDDRGGAVGGDQEDEEVVVVLVDVPAEEARDDHPVAEAGDREGLGDALGEAEDQRLQVGDRVGHGGDHPGSRLTRDESGMTSQTSAPPAGRLTAWAEPPWASATVATIARPRPEPPSRTPGARLKRSKAWSMKAGGKPSPSSVTWISTAGRRRGRRAGARARGVDAARREGDRAGAVAERVVDQGADRLVERRRSAIELELAALPHLDPPARFAGAAGEAALDRLEGGAEAQRLEPQRQLAALGLGDRQQVLGELGEAVGLLGGGGERGAQFLRRAVLGEGELELGAEDRQAACAARGRRRRRRPARAPARRRAGPASRSASPPGARPRRGCRGPAGVRRGRRWRSPRPGRASPRPGAGPRWRPRSRRARRGSAPPAGRSAAAAGGR